MPTAARIPAAAWLCCRWTIALRTIWRTEPGAALVRPVMTGWLADLPSRPSKETRTSRPGKIDRIP